MLRENEQKPELDPEPQP